MKYLKCFITLAQDPSRSNLYLYEDRKPDLNKDTKVPGKTSDVKSEPGEIELKALQDVVHKVKDGPPSLPSICLYSFINTVQRCLSLDIIMSSVVDTGVMVATQR